MTKYFIRVSLQMYLARANMMKPGDCEQDSVTLVVHHIATR